MEAAAAQPNASPERQTLFHEDHRDKPGHPQSGHCLLIHTIRTLVQSGTTEAGP